MPHCLCGHRTAPRGPDEKGRVMTKKARFQLMALVKSYAHYHREDDRFHLYNTTPCEVCGCVCEAANPTTLRTQAGAGPILTGTGFESLLVSLGLKAAEAPASEIWWSEKHSACTCLACNE